MMRSGSPLTYLYRMVIMLVMLYDFVSFLVLKSKFII